MDVVIDTNILVSALWSVNGSPAAFVGMVLTGKLTPCYDYRIIDEYIRVLRRPKFKFTEGEIGALLGWIEDYGKSVVTNPCTEVFIDESDRKFYEVAKYCNAILVTGNKKHFPDDPLVKTVNEFLSLWMSSNGGI